MDVASGLLALTGGVHQKNLKGVHIHETNLKGWLWTFYANLWQNMQIF